MLYQMYETQRNLMEPFADFAQAAAKLYSNPLSPFGQNPFAQRVSASYDLMYRLWKDYEKPQFGFTTIDINGSDVAIHERVEVDKPFTVTLEEARQVVAHAARAQRIVSVFQNRRWDADFLTLQKLIAQDALGEVMEFHSHFDRYRPVVADRWRERDQPGSGVWYDLGPHLLDQALQLFGVPEAIGADIALQRDGAQTADYFHVLLR